MSSKIEKIIVKYLTKSATATDLDILSEWIKTPENKINFKVYVETHYAISYSMNNPNSNDALKRLLLTIKREKSLIFRLKNLPIYKYAAAAMIVGIIGSSYFLKETLSNNYIETEQIVEKNSITAGSDKAILTLSDGSMLSLEKGTAIKTQNANSNGEKIIYQSSKDRTETIAYNYLTIPRGGQFFIELSDGTKVWLNSESQLKYPVAFIEGQIREVELVYGEAYFDVTSSSENKGAKFRVLNKFQEIEVLGTEFNIKAYKDESNIYTTLVEGKVIVSSGTLKQNLIPSQQSISNLNSTAITVKKVDLYNEISWKDGVFSFEDVSLKEIMKVLSRWYDIEVVFEDKNIENEEFMGLLRKDQNIEKLLSTIKRYGAIREYEFKDKILILK